MGWDAYARGPHGGNITDPKIKKAFDNAGKWVRAKTGTVDFALNGKHMGLDVSTCGEMLQLACGKHHYDENMWHPKLMKFNWKFRLDKGDEDRLWAYWSARKFIDVCQQYNLTIKFSW